MRRFLGPSTVLVLTLTQALPATPAGAASPPGIRGPCDPYTQGSWTTRAPVPLTGFVRAWGAFFPSNGRFYAMGGRTSDTAGSDLQNPREYNPATDTWTTKAAAFANNQVNNMVGGVLNFGGTDFIVVVGGSAAGAAVGTQEVRQYDPVGDVMTTLASDPWPGNPTPPGDKLPGGAAVVGNKLYVFGGFQINVSMLNSIWEFDPAAAAGSRWTLKTATLPAPVGYIPAASAGGMIYLMGGADFVGGAIVDTSSSLRYDPGADTIAPIATIPRATGETRAVMQPFDGSIWVLGGGRVAPNPNNEVDVYFPGSNTWGLAPAFPTPRRNFPADMDPAIGRIWTTGGYATDNVTPLAMNEEFDCVVPVDLMRFGVE